MTDVFISYARSDRPVAGWLAEALGREGLDVWWDENLLPGREFRQDITDILGKAACVVVVWSGRSVKSAWVRSEANAAFRRQRLVPVTIDAAPVPQPFDECETLDLHHWRGDPADPAYQKLLAALRDMTGRPAPRREAPLPAPDPHRFTVMIGGIENDIGNQLQDVIAADLCRHDGVHVVTTARVIRQPGNRPQDAEREAHAAARECLDLSGATVMIWGKVLRFGGREVPELRLTIASGKRRPPGRYIPNVALRLPRLFWKDLADILALVCLAYDAEFRAQEGRYLGDRLRPFVLRVLHLVETSAPEPGWNAQEKALARTLVGEAQMLLGIQEGRAADLEGAIGQFRAALQDLDGDAPIDRARAQNGLGISCRVQAERSGDAALLEDALASCQAAVAARDPADDPLAHAQSLNDLGNAWLTRLTQSADRAHWQHAMDAYRAALALRRRGRSALDWAQTRGNIAYAFWQRAEIEGDPDPLTVAARHLGRALEVYTRTETPLDWAQTENTLGLVAWTRGKFTRRAGDFADAARHLRRALHGRRRATVPLLWAETLGNLGLVFSSAAELSTGDTRRFRQAVDLYERALEAVDRADAPLVWCNLQNNLGAAWWNLGFDTNSETRMAAAISAFSNATSVYDQAMHGSLNHVRSIRNLGNAEFSAGCMTADRRRVCAGHAHLRRASEFFLQTWDRETPELVELLFDWGVLLLDARGRDLDPPDGPGVEQLLQRAARMAVRLEMTAHETAILELLRRVGSVTTPDRPAATAGP